MFLTQIKGFDIMRCLVMHLLELRFESLCCEVGIKQPVRLQKLLLPPAFDGGRFDKICIINVEDGDVLVASVRCDGEMALLIAEQHARDFNNGHEDEVHLGIERFLGEWCHSVNQFAIE